MQPNVNVHITPVNHEIPLIPVEELPQMLHDLAHVNKFVKTKQNNILGKTSVYNFKRFLIDYIIYMVETGKYSKENINYYIDAIAIQQASGTNITLFGMNITVNGIVYQFHYLPNKTPKTFVQFSGVSKNDSDDYQALPSEFDIIKDDTVDDIISMWKSLINIAEKYNWCIYQLTNSYQVFVQRISARYTDIVYRNGTLFRIYPDIKKLQSFVYGVKQTETNWVKAIHACQNSTTLNYGFKA